MNHQQPKIQVSLKQMFFAMTLVAAVGAVLAEEQKEVVAGSIGSAICFTIGGLVAVVSLVDLIDRVRKVISEKSWLPVIARIKWIYLDAIGVFLIVVGVSIANLTLHDAVGAGPLIVMGMGILIAPLLYWQFNSRWLDG
ncbi:MAG: hypothetical protein AAF456_12960 [Planctomycetota bacterium]